MSAPPNFANPSTIMTTQAPQHSMIQIAGAAGAVSPQATGLLQAAGGVSASATSATNPYYLQAS